MSVVNDAGDIRAKPIIKTTHISLEDVQDCLAEMPDCFFDFIGSDRQTEVDRLTNECLTYIISIILAANQYNGYFIERFY